MERIMKMEHDFPLGDLEIQQIRLKSALNILAVISEAMEKGQYTAESYADALYCAYDYLSGISDAMENCVQAYYDAEKKKAGAV